MSWASTPNDPNTDERVLKDAQRTIERIVEAMKTALDDELALQQMEYDQLYGVNSMQFAMYQTLVMTFFQDHQMLASLNLKRSRPDLSHGVPEQKRAYLMEMIAERVSSAGPQGAPQQQPFAQQPPFGQMPPGQQVSQQGLNTVGQVSGAWAQQAQPAAQAPPANWLDPQPAAAPQSAPGDWLNQSASKERPPSTAWPTATDDSSTWTLKPGGGQPPAIPASAPSPQNGSNGAAWTAASNSWPTPEEQPQIAQVAQNVSSAAWPTQPEPAQIAQAENQWSGAQNGNPGWADQPGAKQNLPAAAWPASNSGAAPSANAIAMPQPPVAPPGVNRPDFNTPIGDSGQSGTWTMPPKPVMPPAPAWDSSGKPIPGGAPPAPAWNESQGAGNNGNYGNELSQPIPGQLPAAAWSAPSTPSQEMAAWNQPAPAAPPQAPPAPAWSAPTGAMPVPEIAPPNQTIQPWQTPTSGGAPWQPETPAPAWQAPPASVTQSGLPAQLPAPSPPAWEAPPANLTQQQPMPQQQPIPQQQPWQQAQPANQPWQQPAPPAPPQMQQQMQQPQPQPQPWQTPGTTGGDPWGGGSQQYPQQNQQTPMPQNMHMQQTMPPIPTALPGLPNQQEQGWTPPDSPWGGAEGNGAAAPWAQNNGNGMPPPAGTLPAQYQTNNGQSDPYQNQQAQQGQYPSNGQGQVPPQGAPYQMPVDDMSINFNQQNNQPQNAGGTLSGVLRQMRSPENKPKREDEEPRPDNYNPNTAW